MGGASTGRDGGSGDATPLILDDQAQWQADGVKAAGETGARTAPTGAREGIAVSVTVEAALLNKRPCYVSWTGPPDGQAGQAGGGGDPLPGVLRQRVPSMGCAFLPRLRFHRRVVLSCWGFESVAG